MKPEQLAEVFGKNVERRRLELHMTQVDLAAKTGMPQPHISSIEAGKRTPNLATIAKLADGLGIPPSHLLSAEALAAI